MSLHRRTHPNLDVPGCFGCKAATVQVAPSVYSPEVADMKRRDAQLHKDRDAYKRLRADGLQPNHVDGSAALEGTVQDQLEIDWKVPIPAKDLDRVKEIQAEVAMNQWMGGGTNG